MSPQNPPPSPLQSQIMRMWIRGFLAWFVLGVLIILSISYFIWGWPSSSPEEETKPALSQAPATPETPPAPLAKVAPPASAPVKPPAEALEAEISAVLARLAEANQKKDLQQLVSLYSPAFPDRRQKTQEISRSWLTYDYLRLNFKLTEIKSPAPDSASARVTWEIKTRQRQTGEIKEITKGYLVTFTKDAGQWRIQSLEKAKPAGQEKSG